MNRHGDYETIKSEKDILRITTTTNLVLVHFFHKEFRRCQIMDTHLSALSKKHFKTKVVKIDVQDCPFLVARLIIQTLPCVVCFRNGIAVDRVVGFDELGGSDSFSFTTLESRIAKSGKKERDRIKHH